MIQLEIIIIFVYPAEIQIYHSNCRMFPDMQEFNRSLKEITTPKIQKDLVILEDQEGGINCKFGVIYAKNGYIQHIFMNY